MKSFLYKLQILVLAVVSILSACDKDYTSIEEINSTDIKSYIAGNNLTGFKDTLGFSYKVTKPGTGSLIDFTKETGAIFTVRSLDGKFEALDTFAVFNRFGDKFGYFTLPGIADGAGFREVVKNALVKKDGEIRLLIPSRLAYGRNGHSFFEGYSKLSIPGNASLDVTVKVIDDLTKYEDAMIRKYMRENGLTGFKDTLGLHYKVLNPGTGSIVTSLSSISAAYTGKLLNGTVFETIDTANAASFSLYDAGLAKGWRIGIPNRVKVGGTIRLIMPSSLAYGLRGTANPVTGVRDIPQFSPLDFEIKVTSAGN